MTSPPSVYVLSRAALEELRGFLSRAGFSMERRPHQAFLARADGIVINAYESGKVVVSGRGLAADVHAWLAQRAEAPPARDKPLAVSGWRVGVDEAGKGDYFGPLVIAGVALDDAAADALRALGVRDSKQIDNETAIQLAERIRETLPAGATDSVRVEPARYNALYAEMRNLNALLGWGHARVIETLLVRHPACRLAISDQFGNERYIRDALMTRGREVELVQTPRAEREMAVAAASVLARADFLVEVRLMSARYDFRFPLGATHVVDAARAFVRARGADELANVAKLHFRTTARVLDDQSR